jgi:hypothetical protein
MVLFGLGIIVRPLQTELSDLPMSRKRCAGLPVPGAPTGKL